MEKERKAAKPAAATARVPSSSIRPETMYQWLAVQESQKKKTTTAPVANLPNLPMMGMPHPHLPANAMQLQQLNQMLPLMPTYPGFLGFGNLNQQPINNATAANPATTSQVQPVVGANPLNLFNMAKMPEPDDASKSKAKSRVNADVKSDQDGYVTSPTYNNDEMNPLRKRRLERNRESARECRRRKRDHILGVEERCKLLEKENMELRSQLKAGKEAMKQEEDEKYQICQELEKMIRDGASENDLAAKIDNFKEQYSDYGQARRSALSYHLHQLERLLMPTQVTKMCIWALKQDDAFWEDGAEDETSLLSILTHDLGLTEEQRKTIQSHRGAVVKICENLRLALKLLNELKHDVEAKNITLDTEMDQLQNILTPTQRAKFIVWVTNNPACMHLLNKLWTNVL
ncbi:hypothetical protein AC1031_012229 [Aphanomyces cochlioides]|nr:hypothetical protein AC1031_012229 [Aphanomyces cochlioides]